MANDAGGVRGISHRKSFKKSRCPKFNPTDICENIVAVDHWNRHRFEIPDIIGFADYVTASKAVADHLQAYRAEVEELAPFQPFPYPKTNSTLRWLHIAGPEELIVLRTAAGHVVRSTDPLLSRCVHSNRLDRRYRC